MNKITDKEDSQNPVENEKEYRTYTMEELSKMSIKEKLYLNGLGTIKKGPTKAVQITGQDQPQKGKYKIYILDSIKIPINFFFEFSQLNLFIILDIFVIK